MIQEPFLYIKVPASTANLGPGFDTFGLALSKFMYIEVSTSNKWHVSYEEPEFQSIPTDENNFIVKIIHEIAEKEKIVVPALFLKISSDIPLARGLGSSASAIIAAIEIVSHYAKEPFTKEEKLSLALKYESHVDNIGASLFGGFIVGTVIDNQAYCKQLNFPACDIIAIIPSYELATSEARAVLPTSYVKETAVIGSTICATLLAALQTEDWKTAGKMMMSDVFHQPYRSKLIHEYEILAKAYKDLGAYSVTISGAGPTVLVFCEQGSAQALIPKIQKLCQTAVVEHVNIAKNGVEKSFSKTW